MAARAAGRDVEVSALLLPEDTDCISSGAGVFDFYTRRLMKIRDSARDDALKLVLNQKVQALREAWGQQQGRPSLEWGGMQHIRECQGRLCRKHPIWRETQPNLAFIEEEQPVTPRATSAQPRAAENSSRSDIEEHVAPEKAVLDIAQHPTPSPTQPDGHGYLAKYRSTDESGQEKMAAISLLDLQSLSPGQELRNGAVDLFVRAAADRLSIKTGATVRVIGTDLFKAWLDWAMMVPGQLVPDTTKVADQSVPTLLGKSDLGKAQFIFMPWAQDNHFSLVVICNAGANWVPPNCVHCLRLLLW